MTVSSNQSGSQSATINTEHTLGAAITAAGVYVLVVDTANMVDGDLLELRVKTKAKSGSTSRLAYFAIFANAQGELIKYSPPIPADVEVVFTLKQSGGTSRSFDWNILQM
jgi:uncharacterized protein YdaL